MSNDIGTAMIRMLEYGKAMNKPPKSLRRRKKFDDIEIENLDLAELYLRLDAKEKKIKASKEHIEKMMKKEDKKPDSKANMATIAIWLVASFPITGPLYYMWLQKTLGLH